MGKPQPIVTDGTYTINIASLSWDTTQTTKLNITNVQKGVTATFTTVPSGTQGNTTQTFTITDPTTGQTTTHSYDYSWGNKALNGFIIGNGSGGYYIISSADNNANQNYANGDQLVDSSKASYLYYNIGYTDWSNNNYINATINGQSYVFTQDNDGTATGGQIGQSQTNQFTFNTCFMAGSLIETPSGYRKIEDLSCGDEILAYEPESRRVVNRTITWLGKGTSKGDPGLYLEQAGYPVRIKAHALAENVPFEDLLVTSEHCLFLEGAFVPARILVNGHSIYFDTTIPEFTYYHIETEPHSVLFSNGILSESYLNTGNQEMFSNRDNQPDEASRKLSWDSDAAAPLRTSRDFVEPLHARLLARARELELQQQHAYAPAGTSEEMELLLVTDKGERLPQSASSSRYRKFLIPPHADHVFLVSRTARPYDVVGPFYDDRRLLGVLVGNITHFWEERSTDITQHLEGQPLEGWCDPESAGSQRWTQGRARISLEKRMIPDTWSLLAIEILAGGPYPLEETFLFNGGQTAPLMNAHSQGA